MPDDTNFSLSQSLRNSHQKKSVMSKPGSGDMDQPPSNNMFFSVSILTDISNRIFPVTNLGSFQPHLYLHLSCKQLEDRKQDLDSLVI